MKQVNSVLVIAGLALTLGTTNASADTFVNGGFETGDFSGWSQGSGFWTNLADFPLDPTRYQPGGDRHDASANASAIVGPGFDPLTGNQLNMVHSGNFSARINNNNNNTSVSTIYQTVLNYTDPNMFFAWAAVLQASHGPTDSGNFTLQLTDLTDDVVLINRSYSSATTSEIFNQTGGVFWTDWQVEHIDLEALGIQGHDFLLELLAADCPYFGHWGYVYLDGFANVIIPPGVPEPASLLLLGAGGLALLARARRRQTAAVA